MSRSHCFLFYANCYIWLLWNRHQWMYWRNLYWESYPLSGKETEGCLLECYRHKQKSAKLVTRTAVARLPTKWGNFRAYSYRSEIDGIEHVAMVKVFIWTFAQHWEYHDLHMIAISWLHNLLAMLSKLVLHINPFLMSMSSES